MAAKKKKAIDVLKGISKERRDDVMLLSSTSIKPVDTIPTGILSLNIALSGKPDGGYAEGRVVELFGAPSGGKTTIALHGLAATQSNNNISAIIDAEHALDVDYAQKLGVSVKDLIISQPDCGEDALDVAMELSRNMSKGDLIVVDSVAALTPRAEIEGEMGDQHIGLHAKMMSQAMRKITADLDKNKVTIIFINQVRYKPMVTYGPTKTTTGGEALKFYSSQRIEVSAISKVKVMKSGVEEFVGNKILCTMVKNKTFPPFRKVQTEIQFGYGVPRELDLLNLAVARGVVAKSGKSYLYQEGNLGVGFRAAWKHLQEDTEMFSWIEQEVIKSYE